MGVSAVIQFLEDDILSDDQDEMYFGDMVVFISVLQQVSVSVTVSVFIMVLF